MATGDFADALTYAFNGKYQQALQNVSAENAYNQMTTNTVTYGQGSLYATLLGSGLGAGVTSYDEYLQRYKGTMPEPERIKPKPCKECAATSGEPHLASCELWKDRCECHAGRASKIHGALWKLRREITEWHGNVLERCPA